MAILKMTGTRIVRELNNEWMTSNKRPVAQHMFLFFHKSRIPYPQAHIKVMLFLTYIQIIRNENRHDISVPYRSHLYTGVTCLWNGD